MHHARWLSRVHHLGLPTVRLGESGRDSVHHLRGLRGLSPGPSAGLTEAEKLAEAGLLLFPAPRRKGGLATGPRKQSAQGFVQSVASSSGLAAGAQEGLSGCGPSLPSREGIWLHVPGLFPGLWVVSADKEIWGVHLWASSVFPGNCGQNRGLWTAESCEKQKQTVSREGLSEPRAGGRGPVGKEWGCGLCGTRSPDKTSGVACVLAHPGDGKGAQ